MAACALKPRILPRFLRARMSTSLSCAAASSDSDLRVYSRRSGIPYASGLAWQRKLQNDVLSGRHSEHALLLLEHDPPVYTLGRRASLDHILFDVDSQREGIALHSRSVATGSDTCLGTATILGECAEIHRVERGGEVTWHGPGQLVGYSILNLAKAPLKQDLHWYLRQIEEVVIRSLGAVGINDAARHPEYTGVWVGDSKVAAVGLSVSKWVTMHGFAINVNPDLGAFRRIVPCGISKEDTGKNVSSVREILGEDAAIDIAAFRSIVENEFASVFHLRAAAGEYL